MPLDDLVQIHGLFMKIPKHNPAMVTRAISYLQAFRNTWDTEGMDIEDNDEAIALYEEISQIFFNDIREQPTKRPRKR